MSTREQVSPGPCPKFGPRVEIWVTSGSRLLSPSASHKTSRWVWHFTLMKGKKKGGGGGIEKKGGLNKKGQEGRG